MKKFIALILALAMIFTLAACGEEPDKKEEFDGYAVAMISDDADITDESFNQATYKGCKEVCDANAIKFKYYKPDDNTTVKKIASIDQAIADGYNVIVTPGSSFAGALAATVTTYPGVHFIALDISEGDFSGAGMTEIPENLFSAVYSEEVCGYMAGYAAVKMGYRHLGFLGGKAVPAVVRYGYGFVQGIDAAAASIGAKDVVCEYEYADSWENSPAIIAEMDDWYQNKGAEVVFVCGGPIYESVAQSAAKADGKIIGVDVNQAPTIDKYGEGMTITSAMKGLSATVKILLVELVLNDNWEAYGGEVIELGLVSGTNPEVNYVQLPFESTQWNDGFSQNDYINLVANIYSGSIQISDDVSAAPASFGTSITVNDYGKLE